VLRSPLQGQELILFDKFKKLKDSETDEERAKRYEVYRRGYEERKTQAILGFKRPLEWDLLEGLKNGRCPFVSPVMCPDTLSSTRTA
jgi:hypothetical protein